MLRFLSVSFYANAVRIYGLIIFNTRGCTGAYAIFSGIPRAESLGDWFAQLSYLFF